MRGCAEWNASALGKHLTDRSLVLRAAKWIVGHNLIIGNMMSGRLLHRGWSERSTLLTGYAAMALGSWLAFDAHTVDWPWLRYAGVLLFSCVGGLIPGTLFSLAVRLAPAPHLVGSTVGWMQQLSATGQFWGPPLAAALAMAVGGWHLTWLMTCACCVIGAGLALRVGRLPQARQ